MKQFKSQQEALLVKGDHAAVNKALRSLEIHSIPRSERLPLAQLSNRAKDPFTALKLLNSLLRPQGLNTDRPTDDEVAEYANSLHKIGAHQEASQLIMNLDTRKNPKLLKLKAYSCIYQWDYMSAIPLLKSYVHHLTDFCYDQLIGKVNLLAAFISAGDAVESQQLLEELKKTWDKFHLKSGSVLNINLLELEAQIRFNQKNYELSRRVLKQALQLSKDSHSLYTLFIEKWLHIVELFQSPNDRARLSELSHFRKKMKQKKQWNTLRECDLYQAIAMGDDIKISKVYLSTRNPFYKEKIKILAGNSWALKAPIPFHEQSPEQSQGVSPFNHPPEQIFASLVGQARLLKLLQILVSDLYHPFHLGSLFSHLFPDEYFDPFHSPNRVHQLIRRLRNEIEMNQWDLQVIHDQGSYQLQVGKNFPLVLVNNTHLASGKYEILLNQLEASTSRGNISARDAEKLLNCDRSKAIRVLNLGVKEERLIKQGKGKNTTYRFIKVGS